MLRDLSDKGRLLSLILFTFIGSIGLTFLLFPIGLVVGFGDDNITILRISILLQDIAIMFLPAYLVFSWSFQRPLKALGFKKQPHFGRLIFYTLLIYLVSLPLIGVTASWNELIKFPESLKGLETMFRNMEDSATDLIERFFEVETIPNLLINLFVIAFMAALAEEALFRGAMQQLLHRWFKNAHVAVWVAAVIFSAIHLQFYGFFARIIMGAVLGYLYLLTKNLWMPIILHFVNNAAVVVRMHFFEDSKLTQKLENMEPGLIHWFIAVLSAFVTYYLMKKMYLNYCGDAHYDSVLKKRVVKEVVSDNINNNSIENDTD